MAKILVVDDTPVLLDLVREALEDAGHEVRTCVFSRQALKMAAEFLPDVVILDVIMPEVSGWEILDQLRSSRETSELPVIVCTAWAESAAGHLRQRQDPYAWLLTKPFNRDELIELVDEALARLWEWPKRAAQGERFDRLRTGSVEPATL